MSGKGKNVKFVTQNIENIDIVSILSDQISIRIDTPIFLIFASTIAEFVSERTSMSVLYVGIVRKKRLKKKFSIEFLKQYMNRTNEFVYPHVRQIEDVDDYNIISILPKPLIDKRERFLFPYNVL